MGRCVGERGAEIMLHHCKRIVRKGNEKNSKQSEVGNGMITHDQGALKYSVGKNLVETLKVAWAGYRWYCLSLHVNHVKAQDGAHLVETGRKHLPAHPRYNAIRATRSPAQFRDTTCLTHRFRAVAQAPADAGRILPAASVPDRRSYVIFVNAGNSMA